MLERIEITNFQSHDLLRIVFDPHVTTIVGPSDVGKSAIIRALWWLVFDRPLGNAFIQEDADACAVRLWMDNRRLAKRKGEKAEYRIDGQSYKAWGTSGPPEPVTEFLNMGEVNFQKQHDPPYWFCLSAGEVGAALNSVVDLGAIDVVMGKLASSVRAKKSELDVVSSRLVSAEKELERYVDVPEMVETYSSLVEQDKALFSLNGSVFAFGKTINSLKTISRSKEELSQATAAGGAVIAAGERAASAALEASRLEELLKNIKRKKEQADRKLPVLSDVIQKMSTAKSKRLEQEGLQTLVDRYKKQRRKVKDLEEELKEEQTTMEKETGGLCPLCGKPLSDE